MIKILQSLILIGLVNTSYADFLDDWSNDDLCGWMQSSGTPEYIQTEVDKRKVICFGGVQVSSLPNIEEYTNEHGTLFPSPDPSQIIKMPSDEDDGYSY